MGLAVGGTWVWLQFPLRDWPWPWPLAAAAVLYGPVAGYLGSLLVSLYLLVASRFGVNVNELFAGQGIEHGKSFLRLHVAADGTLTIYPMAVDRICRKWVAAPDEPPDAPWLRPAEPLSPRLIEEPVVVRSVIPSA